MLQITLEKDGRAVLPAVLCQEMGLNPGDEVEVKIKVVDGKPGLLLRRLNPDFSWIGSLKGHVKNRDHDLSESDKIIEKTMAREANA